MPAPLNMPVFNPVAGFAPPPPPGFPASGMMPPGMPMMPPGVLCPIHLKLSWADESSVECSIRNPKE